MIDIILISIFFLGILMMVIGLIIQVINIDNTYSYPERLYFGLKMFICGAIVSLLTLIFV